MRSKELSERQLAQKIMLIIFIKIFSFTFLIKLLIKTNELMKAVKLFHAFLNYDIEFHVCPPSFTRLECV